MTTAATTAPKATDLRSLPRQLLFIAVVLGVPFGMGTSDAIFRDGDTSWQVAAGQWILAHGRIPTVDPFSFSAAGHPWVAMEWLAEVIFATAFKLAGYTGLACVVALALMGVQAIIFFYLEKRVHALLLGATFLMMDLVLAPFMLARPHVLAWPLVAAWTILLLKGAEKGRPPPLWIALILVAWTNLHASFPIALVIAAAIGLDALIEARWTNLREWIVFGAVSLIAICCNANGPAGLLQPFRTASLSMLPLIGEWQASSPEVMPFFYAVLLVGLGGLLWSGKRIPIGRLVLLLLLLALAFAHMRHQSLFIIVAACIVPLLWRGEFPAALVPKWFLLCALPLLAFRLAWPVTPPETKSNPRHLLAAIPAPLRSQPVFNDYTFGGPLILAGVRPYIDGRAELYGDAYVKDYVTITGGDMKAFNRAATRYGIRWTMLSHYDQRLIDALESSGRWHRIYADEVGVIDVRDAGPAQSN